MSGPVTVSLKSWLTLAVLGLIWGSSFILIKKSLVALTPVQLACMRISISSMAFLPILVYNRKKVEWQRWKTFLLVGITGSGLPAFLYAIAQTNVNSSLAGMLNSMTPIFTLIIGMLFFRLPFVWTRIIGVLLGFGGVSLLIYSDSQQGGASQVAFALLIIGGTICYGTSVNVVKEYFQETRSIIISAMSFTLIGLPAIIYLIITDALSSILAHESAVSSLLAISTLALLGTVLSTIIFYGLVKETSAVFASSVAYIMPLVALGWGYLDGEVLTIYHLIGMITILIGIYIIKSTQ